MKVTLPSFDPKKVTYWGGKEDVGLSHEELLLAFRWLQWCGDVDDAVSNRTHQVLMTEVFMANEKT